MTKSKEQAIIQRFKERVTETLGDRLDRIVLFGSRARGDAEEDSDFDFLVMVRTPDNEDKNKIREITVELSVEFDTVITALVTSSRDFVEERYFYLHQNIQKEGQVVLAGLSPRTQS
jgi:predicted nucleotidyltransferase